MAGAFRPGQARGPCVAAQPQAPVPTANCADGNGQDSYLADDFSRDRGWWLRTAGTPYIITGGELSANAPGTDRTDVRLTTVGRALVGAELITSITNFKIMIDGPSVVSTSVVASRVYGSPWLCFGRGPALNNNNAQLFIAADATGASGAQYWNDGVLYPNNGTVRNYEFKIVASLTGADYYVNGVLVFTFVGALSFNINTYANYRIYQRSVSGPEGRGDMTSMVVYGYGLPVDC